MAKIKRIEDVDKNMVASVDENKLVYYDPRVDKRFKVEGLAWFNEELKYARLPQNSKADVTDAVFWLANQPSGGQIRFISNARKISVKIKNQGDYEMCHMAATGQQGADLYYKSKKDRKYKFNTCAKFTSPTSEFEAVLFDADEAIEREFIINLPLYEGLADIYIAIEGKYYVKPPKDRKQKGKIVFYGTSITQGGCATRPGMSFTNILSRRLDSEFINLGFSGSGLGEIELARLINKIDDVSLLVLDYEANGGATGDMLNNLEPFINEFRSKHQNTPLVVLSKPPYGGQELKKSSIDQRNKYFNFQRNMVLKHQENGDKNIYFIDGNKLYGTKDIDECSVDGLHPTDLGFYRMANYLCPILKKILKK